MLDKYYTKPHIAEMCVDILKKHIDLDSYYVIEPSAGNGSFLPYLPESTLALDIQPDNEYIIEMDFFDLKTNNIKKDIICVGNPPFGKNSSLALKFINHAALFSKYIAFILPRTFSKESMINKLHNNLFIVEESILPEDSFIGVEVTCNFYIFKKELKIRNKIVSTVTTKDFSFVTDTPDFLIRRVGALSGKVLTEIGYSKQSNYYIKANINKEELIERLTSLFSELQEVAKNTVSNPSLSKTELISIYTKKFN
jgi:predicted RNA methylase